VLGEYYVAAVWNLCLHLVQAFTSNVAARSLFSVQRRHGTLCTGLQGGPKMAHFVRLITSSNIDRFSIFFTIKISSKFSIVLSLKIPPHLNCGVTLPCEMSVLEATTENKTTSVTTHLRVRRPCSSKAETLNIWSKNYRMRQLYFRQQLRKWNCCFLLLISLNVLLQKSCF